jgi:tRNA (guanosine-2'-O-)-methyltransferase
MEVMQKRQKGLIIVLEDIYDPHNAAAILRSAEAFGAGTIYFIFNTEKEFNPRQIGKRSSSSANKWLEFKIFKTIEECTKELKKQKYTIIATALIPDAKSIFRASFTSPRIALMFGNESRGLSPKALSIADEVVSIPMRGMVESLNLSVSAGIFLFEITRRRLATMKKHVLTTREAKAATKRILRT